MKYLTTPLLATALSLSIIGCDDRKPNVVEKPIASTENFETSRLGLAIDAYIAAPSETLAANVDGAFAQVDSEIAELDQRVATSNGEATIEPRRKATNLRAYRDKERLRYTEAQVRVKAAAAGDSLRDMGDRVEDSARKAGNAVKDGVNNAADAVKDALP